MTMPFTISDRATLDDLRVDDEVEGSLRIRSDSKGIEDYRAGGPGVARPARRAAPDIESVQGSGRAWASTASSQARR